MRTIVSFMFAGVLLLLTAQQSMAVPAWSRLTGSDCTSCHASPTFQLTPFGLDFLRNGHRLNATKLDASTQKFENYLSLVWKFRGYYEENKKPRTQFEQHSFSLYSGGALADRFSYFTEMYLSENTGGTSGGNVTQGDAARKKLAEAFLQYNQPVGNGFLAVRAGEILPEILHVFGVGARSAEQRSLVLNDKANSANPYKPFTRSQGIDAKLNMEKIEVTLGVVDGAANATNAIDTNNSKDTYAAALLVLDEHDSAVGVFRYDGKYSVYATADDPATAVSYVNDFSKNALLARFIRDKWRVVGTYFIGEDTTSATGSKTDNEGYYALVDYNFTNTFGVYGRYDMLDPDSDNSNDETTLALVGLNGMLYMSDKSGARWAFDLSEKEVQSGAVSTKTKKVQLQLTWAF